MYRYVVHVGYFFYFSLRKYCLDFSFMYHISRNNYDVACPMNFRKYPYDTQVCKVKYESCK